MFPTVATATRLGYDCRWTAGCLSSDVPAGVALAALQEGREGCVRGFIVATAARVGSPLASWKHVNDSNAQADECAARLSPAGGPGSWVLGPSGPGAFQEQPVLDL